MHQLFASFSLPWWFWVGLGVFLTLLVVSPKVRTESDAFLARLLGMKPKQRQIRRSRRIQEDEDDEE
jgi:hypothetical protein